MAGKPKDAKWGGARKGAGGPKKPPVDYDEKFKTEFEETLEKLKKKYGKGVLETALEMVYDKDVQDTVKVALLKVYAEVYAVKKSEQTVDVNKKVTGPAIILPAMEEDPALKIISGGKK